MYTYYRMHVGVTMGQLHSSSAKAIESTEQWNVACQRLKTRQCLKRIVEL